ncbi:YTH-domain-containing protein [Hyaloscypha variabilis F]|uniref:YTH-domain-containing protein n=1 Tax=Hyaloscypha variabilis (strain UAMH 11265 / GT02V1 / F) TaxID=1149755 RepID=A0A2J6S673_HYAVF|nr:YTH-domain-containing protein [Hyaloscypha variabilis F]
MWQSNGFGNNGHFPNGFNNQENFPLSPFGAPSGQGLARQQYFTNQQNMMQLDDASGEDFPNREFQPEVGLYNEGAFMQNQFINANPLFSQSTFNQPNSVNPIPPRPVQQINARAAELKAELLKRREGRGASSTPPISTSGQASKTAARVDTSSSLRGPKLPINAEMQDQELNVNDLISQYSEAKPAANASVKQEKTLSTPTFSNSQRTPKQPEPAKSQAPSLGSPTKVTVPAQNGQSLGLKSNGKTLGAKHHSNGSVSEASEGEIREDAPTKSVQPPKVKETQIVPNKSKADEQPARDIRDDQAPKSAYYRGSRDNSPPRRPPPTHPKTQPPQWGRDDRRDSYDSRSDQRYQPEQKIERKQYPESEKKAYTRRDSRDEEYRRAEPIAEPPREDYNRQVREPEQKAPTLVDLLPHDDDLREWLDITGYHNAPYRNKILNRRRAIAALDAQRDKLLAEMEAEERGGLPVALASQTSASSMLPPPIPTKVPAGGRVEPPLTSAGNSTMDSQRDRVVSNKRPYSDVQDPREEPSGGKIARTDDRPYGRVKEEHEPDFRRLRVKEEDDDYRPRSSGFEATRRSSIDPRDDRYAVRGRSREREMSPGRRAYEGRPSPRSYSYGDNHSYRDELPFESRGYRGKPYEPSFRGRGRGRARDAYDRYPQELDTKNEPSFGSRIANGRPFMDSRGFDRGGKGDTRYFIVKSFNEDNVLNCIEDSIWTTQVQNGSVFKEAFETCKNVILVFSINKSRAFQGYARMESLPGSVAVPDWQKAINWDTAGAFRVRWLVICATRFHRVGHLKNALNDNQAVLIGKDGQEIEENCGRSLVELIDEECEQALASEEWKVVNYY